MENSPWGPRWNPVTANTWNGSRYVGEVLSLAASRLRGDGTVTHDVNGFDLLAV